MWTCDPDYVDLGRSKLCLCWQRSKGKAKAFGISIGDSNVECGRNVYFLVRILLMNIFEYIWGHLRQLSWYRKYNMKYIHHSLKDLHYMFNVEISKMQVFKNIKYCCCEVDGIKLYKWKLCYLLDFLDELTSDGLGPNEWSHIFRSLFYIICIVFQERNLIVGNNMWRVILMWILMLVFVDMIHISASLWQPSGRSGAGTGLEPVGGESLESAGPPLGTHKVVSGHTGPGAWGTRYRGTPLSWFSVFLLLLCCCFHKSQLSNQSLHLRPLDTNTID